MSDGTTLSTWKWFDYAKSQSKIGPLRQGQKLNATDQSKA
jgi:hypothetical protein